MMFADIPTVCKEPIFWKIPLHKVNVLMNPLNIIR